MRRWLYLYPIGSRNLKKETRNDVVVPIIEGIIAELRNRQVFDLVTEIASVIPSRVLAGRGLNPGFSSSAPPYNDRTGESQK